MASTEEEDQELHGWTTLRSGLENHMELLMRIAEDREKFRFMTVNMLKALDTL